MEGKIMKRNLQLLAVPAMALGMVAFSAAGAQAADSYSAQLTEQNGSGASGSVSITLDGNMATVSEKVNGLAKIFDGNPYPHVQHAHVTMNETGKCPTIANDKNGDGVVSTPEGGAAYGEVATTLSTKGDTSPKAATDLKVAGMGDSFTYERTFEMNQKTIDGIKNGQASVVVHGLDPATLGKDAQAAKSELVPELPLAATAPALCGTLTAGQMDMPQGNPETGGGSTAGMDASTIALGGGLVLAAAGAGVFMVRRRQAGQN